VSLGQGFSGLWPRNWPAEQYQNADKNTNVNCLSSPAVAFIQLIRFMSTLKIGLLFSSTVKVCFSAGASEYGPQPFIFSIVFA